MQRIPAIGPLRAVAAGLVLVSHVAFWTGGGNIDLAGRLFARGDAGVACFFAITAFLLVRPYLAERPVEPPRVYVRRRLARIMPAYWAALIAVLAVASVTSAGLGGPGKVLAHLALLQGYTGETYQGFTQTWSLTTELTFYALLPLIGRWMSRCRIARRSPLPLLALVAGCSLVIQALSASSGRPALGILSTSVLAHATWFCAGLGWAWCTTQRPDIAARVSPARALGLTATLYVLAATPLGGPVSLQTPSLMSAASKEALYGLLALTALAAATQARPATQAVCARALPTALGEMSYGVFLWHVLVIQVLFLSLGLHLFQAPFLLVLVPTALFASAAAWASWHVIESPVLTWAHRSRPEAAPGRGSPG